MSCKIGWVNGIGDVEFWRGGCNFGFPARAGLFPYVSRPEAFECGLDGLRVDMPHEGSDVLNLSAPGATAPYFVCEFDGRQKLIRQIHGLKLTERQGDQLFAQALQSPVFIFLLGSAFIIRIHFTGRSLPVYPASS